MSKKVDRFVLVAPNGDREAVPRAETPGAVLSKAITRAGRTVVAGTWEVYEYEDRMFLVHGYGPGASVAVAVEDLR